MTMKLNILFLAFCTSIAMFADNARGLKKENVTVDRIGNNMMVSMDLVLDSTRLGSNSQLFVTPVIQTADGSEAVALPSVLFNGRNMHYIYMRDPDKALPDAHYQIAREVYHRGTGSTRVRYEQSTPLQDWMSGKDAVMRVIVDTCGCRDLKSKGIEDYPLYVNKAPMMFVMPYPTPVVGDEKILVHQGKAKVQFEVDRFELHEDVYTYTNRITKRRHTIDNREQLKLIDDSLQYALSSPNVELTKVEVCGFASPESPYDHNEYLALNRSKAVMLYLEKHKDIADSICTYSAVPENWAGFREQVLAATDITERQRTELLQLIDRPIHSSSDYDRKEKELNSSQAFSSLYHNTIRPDWFPDLRYTQFAFYTKLKPFTDEQLREVMKVEPERLSLSQFYRVALSYGHGTKEFHETLNLALKYYPEDETANCNAAALAIEAQRYDDAKPFLLHAGDSDDANILRGIVATNDGDLNAARAFFQKAIKQVEAQRNLNLIK